MERTKSRRIAAILGLAAAYAIVGRLGLLFEPVGGFATLVWPPSGIALVALVAGGPRLLWPGVAIGAFAVNLSVGAPPLVAVGIAIGSTLEAVLAAELLRRYGFDRALERMRDVAQLAIAGAGLSTLLAAVIGVGSLAAGSVITPSQIAPAFRAWWLGDAMGDLVIAPALASWARPPLPLRDASNARKLEAFALAAIAILCGAVVFRGANHQGTMYLLFPPLAWSAVRFGQRGASATVLAISAIAIACASRPFVGDGLPSALLDLQSFMAVVAIVALLLGAAIAERDRARAIAERAVRARDDFLAIASHELRNPLSALVMQLAALRQCFGEEGGADPSSANGLARAVRQADRIERLIGNLLDVSRSESGQLQIRPEPIDLAPLVRDLVDRMREPAARAGCALRAEIADHAQGRWDWLRLEQVLGNLLANAFRYARGAPVDVVLRAGDEITLEVRDHGPGIAPDQLEHIFDRYHRGGARPDSGGLGLGLYIARRLIEAHGGAIGVRSSTAGSTFVVTLPRDRGAA